MDAQAAMEFRCLGKNQPFSNFLPLEITTKIAWHLFTRRIQQAKLYLWYLCRQRRPRTDCANAQSDQGLCCPQTRSLYIPKNVSTESKCPDETLRMCRRMRSLIRAFAVRKQDHCILKNVSTESKCPDKTLRMCRRMWIRTFCARSRPFSLDEAHVSAPLHLEI